MLLCAPIAIPFYRVSSALMLHEDVHACPPQLEVGQSWRCALKVFHLRGHNHFGPNETALSLKAKRGQYKGEGCTGHLMLYLHATENTLSI